MPPLSVAGVQVNAGLAEGYQVDCEGWVVELMVTDPGVAASATLAQTANTATTTAATIGRVMRLVSFWPCVISTSA